GGLFGNDAFAQQTGIGAAGGFPILRLFGDQDIAAVIQIWSSGEMPAGSRRQKTFVSDFGLIAVAAVPVFFMDDGVLGKYPDRADPALVVHFVIRARQGKNVR